MKTFKQLKEEIQLNESNARELAKHVAGSYPSTARLYPSNKAGFKAKMTGPPDTEYSEKRKALGVRTQRNWKHEEAPNND